jgi:hypothetical protein
MDNDDEMMAEWFMLEEANATVERQQWLLLFANLLAFASTYCRQRASAWKIKSWEGTQQGLVTASRRTCA